MQTSNGQPTHPKPKVRYTGALMDGRTVRAIVDALSQGEPVDRIARRLHVSKQSVRGVRERECVEIDRRKQLIAAQAARGATEAFDQLNERLLTEKIPTALLVPIAGMCTDKVIALGDPTLTFRHEHFHVITDDDLLAFAVARSERRRDASLQQEKPPRLIEGRDPCAMRRLASTPETHHQAKKTWRKKRRKFSDNFGHSNCVILRDSYKLRDLHFHR